MENTVENKRNLPWFITKIVLNVIFYVVIIILLLFSIMNINAGSSNQGFPNIFGKGFLSVQSDSMTRTKDIDGYENYEIGAFSRGDLLFVDVVDTNNINNLKIGDVITFYDESIGANGALNSHRIVYINYNADNTIESISVQGDKTASEQAVFNPDNSSQMGINNTLQTNGAVQTFAGTDLNNIKGVVTGISVGTGTVLENIQQNWVFYFIIPVAIFLIIEIFIVIKNIMDLKGSKNKLSVEEQKEALRLELEAEKEKMRQELLKELQGNNPTLNNEPAKEENIALETKAEEAIVVATAETKEETPVVEETPIVEETTPEETTTPEVTETPVEEAKEETPVAEVEKPKTTRKPRSTSTSTAAAKKTTTAKKSTTSTAAKKTTATKSTAAKKPATTKAASTTSTTKKSTGTTAKKATTTTKKTSAEAKTSTTKKATTAKKTASTGTTKPRTTTKKAATDTKKEESE